MEALIQPLLSLLGIAITAYVTWMVAKRSTKAQEVSEDNKNKLGLVDRYKSEIDRIDDKLKEQSADIATLSQQNVVRTTEVLKLREEMAQVRRDHLAETAKLEVTLTSFRGYIASILDWVNRRFESGELDTEVDIPAPPPEYAHSGSW